MKRVFEFLRTSVLLDPITLGVIIVIALLVYGNCQEKAHGAETPAWFDVSLNTDQVLKPNKYPSLGLRVNHIEEGFSASEIWDSGLCIQVRGICMVNPVLYGSFTPVGVNNFPVSGGVGARSFLRIITAGYGFNTDGGGDEARIMFDFVALGVAGYGAFAKE
jgi:hypothetical protein